jgi:hypothetical protein
VATAAELIAQVTPYTKTGIARMQAMVDSLAAIDQNNIPGDVVECGVWKAGNIILARKLSPHRVCWLYDTFTGMTEPGDVDVRQDGGRPPRKTGWCAAPVGEVVEILWRTGVLDGILTRFVIGDVCNTLREHENVPDKIALLRLDTDWYASTKIELEVLYPKLQPGGILIVDDYGHWQGARKAVDEYFGKDYPKTMIDYTACLIRK